MNEVFENRESKNFVKDVIIHALPHNDMKIL